MRLYYHPVSPYARKALVAVRLRGDDVALHCVDVRAGELRSPEFLALNPLGRIPVLLTPEGPLPESTSVIEYLEERGPRVLLPVGSERVARHWDRIGDTLIEQQTVIWFEPRSDAAPEARRVAHAGWALVDARLGATGDPFLAGSAFTLADLAAAIGTDYLVRLGEVPPPAVAAWVARCFALPAMAGALAEAQPMIDGMLARRAAQLG